MCQGPIFGRYESPGIHDSGVRGRMRFQSVVLHFIIFLCVDTNKQCYVLFLYFALLESLSLMLCGICCCCAVAKSCFYKQFIINVILQRDKVKRVFDDTGNAPESGCQSIGTYGHNNNTT